MTATGFGSCPAVIATALLLLASCGGGEAVTTVEAPPTTAGSTATEPPDVTTEPAETSQTTIVVEPCMEPATEVAFGTSFQSELSADENTVYLCVEVPGGITLLRFELTEATGDLTLYVGYPHLENVQQGGLLNLEFWESEEEDRARVVIMEPLIHQGGLLEEDTQDEFVRPGSYYIEVSRTVSGTENPFSLSVTQG